MKKFLYVLLATSFLFASCGGDDNKKENNNENQNQNQNQSESSTIDFAKFCDNIMGKSCGEDISDDAMTQCVALYEGEYKAYPKCSLLMATYYKCVIDAACDPADDDCECFPEDACNDEVEAAHSCLVENYPDDFNDSQDESINFDNFCNHVMGKSCGAQISNEGMDSCKAIYIEEFESHAKCTDDLSAYYKWVADIPANTCIQEDACADEMEAAHSCLVANYPDEFEDEEIDFDNFCNHVMGKSCGAQISDDDMNSCKALYIEEFESHAKCTDDLSAYYKCIADISANTCLPEDACNAKTEAAHSCLVANYPDEFEDEEIDFDNFCNHIMGKSCGAQISDDDMNSCKALYIEEFESHAKCTDDLSAYYKCVADISADTCLLEDACNAKTEAAHSCLVANYPDEFVDHT